MSIQFRTELGVSISLPDGSEPVSVSSAGVNSQQFSLPSGDLVSMIRDYGSFGSLADVVAWTQGSANYYVVEFEAVEEMQGAIHSPAKQSYAFTVSFTDRDQTPRRATLIGCLLDDGAFVGMTLLTIDAGIPLDTELVEGLVTGLTLSPL